MDVNIRILILEDNPFDADLMEFELTEAGLAFTPKRTKNQKEFLRELEDFSPDLILSDYDLPQYNGLLALIQSRSRLPGVPFILVTGALDEDGYLRNKSSPQAPATMFSKVALTGWRQPSRKPSG